jgi:hypothetical protein
MPAWTNAVTTWLTDNGSWIAAVKDIVTVLAAVIASGALVIAVRQFDVASSQLEITSSQLKTTAASIKSNTIYQLAHEGREISREWPKLRDDSAKAGLILSFMHGAWHQRRLGTVDEEIWVPLTEELCAFMRGFDVKRYWTPASQKTYSAGFVDFVNERIKACAS